MTDEIKRLRSEFASSGYDMKKLSVAPSSDKEELPELLRKLEQQVEELGVAIGQNPNVSKSYCQSANRAADDLRAQIESLFARVQRENERLTDEIKACGEMYKQVCDPLQECCQKYKLGLGGEMCHELVIAEVDGLRSNIGRWRDELMRAGGALRSGTQTRTKLGRICYEMRMATALRSISAHTEGETRE